MAVEGCLGGLLMLGVIVLGFVLVGARLFSTCIGFSLPALLSIMMVCLVLLWTLWYGLRVGLLRGVGLYMLFEIGPFFLGLLGFGMGSGALLLRLIFLVMILSYGLFLLVCLLKCVAFLSTPHWPQDGADLGVGGVSYELLILYELWAGERWSLEKAHPRYLRSGRPISVSAVPFGPGTDIWRSCRYIGALFRALVFAWRYS